jgi:hypothetical protein
MSAVPLTFTARLLSDGASSAPISSRAGALRRDRFKSFRISLEEISELTLCVQRDALHFSGELDHVKASNINSITVVRRVVHV